MNRLRGLLSRLTGIFRRERADRDVSAELRSHIEMHVEDNLRAGMTLEEARREALVRLGGVEQTKEEVRRRQGLPWLETLAQDVRFGLRILRKNPAFTTIAVLTLALGIGANTAIFSLVNAVLLNALPVARPHELVLFSDSPFLGGISGRQTGAWEMFSSEDYKYFTAHNESFKELAAYQANRNSISIQVQGTQRPESARTEMVSGNFFSFLGLRAAAGRLFAAEDDREQAAGVAVLAYDYWTRRFHDDPAVVGQTLDVNGNEFTVVGVAPRGFRGVNTRIVPDVWLPLVAQPVIIPGDVYATREDEYWLSVIGRIKPGVKLPRAQAVVSTQLHQVMNTYIRNTRETEQQITDSHVQLVPGAGGVSTLRIQYERALEILQIVAALVLLMACANVVNMLFARSMVREREISVRLAIGATRSRLIRQLLTEGMMLAALGGAAGIVLARWGAEILVVLAAGNGAAVEPNLDTHVLAFTAAVSLLAGIFFGLAPALRAGRTDLTTQIKGSAKPRLGRGFPNAIVVIQVAGCVVLVVGAGLFIRTLQKLADQSLGLDQDHMLTVHIDPLGAGYKMEQTPQLYQALIDRVSAIDGVRFATVDFSNPLSGSLWTSNFSIEGRPDTGDRSDIVHKQLVGPNYFQTEGIPILVGRDIEPEDRAGMPLVTVINEAMARKYFPGANPVGQRFSLGAPFNEKEAMTIIGVAADARYYSLRDNVPPMEFVAAFQVPDSSSHNAAFATDIEIRTTGDPRAIASEIRPAIKEVAAGLPVSGVIDMKQQVRDALRQNRSLAELSSGFGALTLLLACIGLYGTLAYRVSRRTQEIGVRMALGAQRAGVMWMVVREGLLLVVPGIVIGMAVAAASSKVIVSELFGISPNDLVTFVGTAVLLVLVALAACWMPALRAMRVDPMVALRYE